MSFPILLNCAIYKGSALGMAFGRFIFCFPTWFIRFWIFPHGSVPFFAKSDFDNLSHLILTLMSLESRGKNIPLNINMIAESKKR